MMKGEISMHARELAMISGLSDKRLLSIDEFCTYASVGKSSALDIIEKTGCKFKIGRRVLIDRAKFDRYCDENKEIETTPKK